MAIKTPRSGFPGGVETIKVRIKVRTISMLRPALILGQKFLKEVHAWSKLAHENVLPLIGITTQFDLTVSIVSPWMAKGNARNHVLRDKSVDPRPLVRRRYFKRTLSECCLDSRDRKWAMLPAQSQSWPTVP